jgi:hypothetical protein
MKRRKIIGISRRVKPKDEKWFLRINNENVFEVITKTKRERNILSGIRKMMIAYEIRNVDLTNREKYIKNVNVSQEKLLKMKAEDKYPIREILKGGMKNKNE